MLNIDVAFVLELVPEDLAGKTTVVIDVLRATSTILAACGAGAPYIVPVTTLEEAQALAAEYADQGGCYVGGERNKLKPAGFDFGNSPREYLQLAEAKPIVFTTTNGTRALKRVATSRQVLIASMANGAAVAEKLLNSAALDVLLVCSGTLGKIAAEDVLCAGLIISEVEKRAPAQLTDGARIALASYRQVAANLEQFFLHTTSGQGLSKLGLRDDVLHAARINHSSLVPYYADGRIRA